MRLHYSSLQSNLLTRNVVKRKNSTKSIFNQAECQTK